jgi:hypothetical protein
MFDLLHIALFLVSNFDIQFVFKCKCSSNGYMLNMVRMMLNYAGSHVILRNGMLHHVNSPVPRI